MSIYILSNKKIDGALNLPVMEINFIKQDIDFDKYDALIVASKYALTAIDSFSNTWKNKPIYAIAPQTADVVKTLGGNLEFTGTKNNGNDFALEILEKLKNKKVLYLRGEKKVSSLVEILNKNEIKCDEVIVYKSVCKDFKEKQNLPKNSIIIFSSPTTVECFLKNYNWNESFRAVAFGKTTASYLPKNIIAKISKESSLKACVQMATLL